mgnify:FL=1
MKKAGQYFKVFFRHFLKNKIYSVFSLVSLVVALTTCLIILIYAHHEYSYDRFHKNYDQIYRVLVSDSMKTTLYARIGYPVTEYLQKLPEVDQTVVVNTTSLNVQSGNGFIKEDKVLYTQPSFFEVFDFRLLSGSIRSLDSPGNVFISETFADKMSMSVDAIGKELTIKTQAGKKQTFTIAGVFRDFPDNSHLEAHILLPFTRMVPYYRKHAADNWDANNVYFYLRAERPQADLEAKINRNLLNDVRTFQNVSFTLQPLSQVHLFSNDIELNLEQDSVYKELLISLGIAFLVIFIAVANYVIYILSIANTRVREIILRKTLGADKRDLYGQVIWESLFQLIIALPFVALATYLLIPYLENYFDFQVVLGDLYRIFFIFLAAAFFLGLLVGTLVSTYMILPSLGKIRTMFIQTSTMKIKGGHLITIVQLSLCIACIISLLSIQKQLHFAMNPQTVGFDYTNQLSLRVNNRQLISQWDAFKNELLKHPEITHVAACMTSPPSFSTDVAGFKWEYDKNGKKYGFLMSGHLNDQDKAEMDVIFEKNNVTADYFKTLGINRLEGREFDASRNESGNIIVNQAFVKKHQIMAPLNKTIDFLDGKFKIIGIVNDFKTKSLFKDKSPVVFMHTNRYLRQIVIRYQSPDHATILDKINTTWNNFIPGTPLDYSFTEDVVKSYYHKERRLYEMVHFYSLLAVLLSVINLTGYSRLTFNNREKEIGIRRVFGAGLIRITRKLLKPYLVYLLISIFVGVSMSSFFLNHWFAQFSEQVHLQYFEYNYILAGMALFFMGLVFINILNINKKNPIRAIRCE